MLKLEATVSESGRVRTRQPIAVTRKKPEGDDEATEAKTWKPDKAFGSNVDTPIRGLKLEIVLDTGNELHMDVQGALELRAPVTTTKPAPDTDDGN